MTFQVGQKVLWRSYAEQYGEDPSGEYWTMGESLIQQCRVSDEGLSGCKVAKWKGQRVKLFRDETVLWASCTFGSAFGNLIANHLFKP